MDTETQQPPVVRKIRKRRVVTEVYDGYSFNLPVAMMERFRRVVEFERSNYSAEAEAAFRIYLATKIHIPDMTEAINGHSGD